MAGEPIATAAADDDDKPSGASSSGDFVIRHCRSSPPAARDPSLRAFLPGSRPRALEVGRAASFPSCGGWDRLSRRPRAEEDGGVPGGYTSLRDLIDFLPTESSSSAVGARSPATPRGVGGSWEIRIKNHLVKQAAYAYLQPTPSASESDQRRRRLTLRQALSLLTCGLAVDTLDLCIAFLRRLFRHPR